MMPAPIFPKDFHGFFTTENQNNLRKYFNSKDKLSLFTVQTNGNNISVYINSEGVPKTLSDLFAISPITAIITTEEKDKDAVLQTLNALVQTWHHLMETRFEFSTSRVKNFFTNYTHDKKQDDFLENFLKEIRNITNIQPTFDINTTLKPFFELFIKYLTELPSNHVHSVPDPVYNKIVKIWSEFLLSFSEKIAKIHIYNALNQLILRADNEKLEWGPRIEFFEAITKAWPKPHCLKLLLAWYGNIREFLAISTLLPYLLGYKQDSAHECYFLTPDTIEEKLKIDKSNKTDLPTNLKENTPWTEAILSYINTEPCWIHCKKSVLISEVNFKSLFYRAMAFHVNKTTIFDHEIIPHNKTWLEKMLTLSISEQHTDTIIQKLMKENQYSYVAFLLSEMLFKLTNRNYGDHEVHVRMFIKDLQSNYNHSHKLKSIREDEILRQHFIALSQQLIDQHTAQATWSDDAISLLIILRLFSYSYKINAFGCEIDFIEYLLSDQFAPRLVEYKNQKFSDKNFILSDSINTFVYRLLATQCNKVKGGNVILPLFLKSKHHQNIKSNLQEFLPDNYNSAERYILSIRGENVVQPDSNNDDSAWALAWKKFMR